MKRFPDKQFEIKFTIFKYWYGVGVAPGNINLLQWVNTFVFLNVQNGMMSKISENGPAWRCPRSRRSDPYLGGADRRLNSAPRGSGRSCIRTEGKADFPERTVVAIGSERRDRLLNRGDPVDDRPDPIQLDEAA